MKNELYSFETAASLAAPLHAPVGPRCREASVSCGLKGHPNGAQGNAVGNPVQSSSSFSSAARRAAREHLRRNENQESTTETATQVSHQKKQIKIAHFFSYFSLQMYAISHTIMKNASPNGARAEAPLPTSHNSHSACKTAKKPRIPACFPTQTHTIPARFPLVPTVAVRKRLSTFFTFSTRTKKLEKPDCPAFPHSLIAAVRWRLPTVVVR